RSSNTNLVPEENIVIVGAGNSRTVTVTPARNQSGSSKITLLVNDLQFGLASTSFRLTVGAVDDVPTISTISDQTVSEDSGPVAPMPFQVDDVETPGHAGVSGVFVTTLNVDGCSTNAPIPAANVVYGGSGHGWALVFQPAPEESGTSRISIVATNAIG